MASRKSHITSFVSASKSSKYLVPAWHDRIHEYFENEEYENSEWEPQLLDENSRLAIWGICKQLGVGTETVAPTACLLLEKYMENKSRQAAEVATDGGRRACSLSGAGEEWAKFVQDTCKRFPLLAATSVQLVAKMSSAAHKITTLKVQQALIRKGFEYSLSHVARTEFEVFQTIGFKIPLWSSLETSQLLCREAGLSLTLLPVVARVVELAELRRPTLEREVAEVVSGSVKLATLHLCAGAVAAAAKLSGVDVDPAPAIASFTKAPVSLVKLLADLIVTMSLDSESSDEESSSD